MLNEDLQNIVKKAIGLTEDAEGDAYGDLLYDTFRKECEKLGMTEATKEEQNGKLIMLCYELLNDEGDGNGVRMTVTYRTDCSDRNLMVLVHKDNGARICEVSWSWVYDVEELHRHFEEIARTKEQYLG